MTIRQRFSRSGEFWALVLMSALFLVVAIMAAGQWVAKGVFVLLLAVMWSVGAAKARRTFVRIHGGRVEIGHWLSGVVVVPRSEIRSIEAHSGDPAFHSAAGRVHNIAAHWGRDEFDALGRALEVPVCYGDGQQCRRAA